MTDITETIAATANDGFARQDWTYGMESGSVFTTTSPYVVKQGYSDDSYGTVKHFHSFLHFTTIAIPNGATISAAKIQMEYGGFESNSVGESFDISAEDVDDASAPTTVSEVFDATLTTANATWTVASMSSGTWYDSPELKTVIQEIVDRSGWASNNNITIMLHNNSAGDWYVRWKSRTTGASYAPKLIITYSTGSSTPIAAIAMNTYKQLGNN